MSLWVIAGLLWAGYALLAATTDRAGAPLVSGVFIVLSVSMWLLLRRHHGR